MLSGTNREGLVFTRIGKMDLCSVGTKRTLRFSLQKAVQQNDEVSNLGVRR